MTSVYTPNIDGATSGDILSGWANVGSTAWTVGAFHPVSGHTLSFGLAAATTGYAVNSGGATYLDGELTFDQVLAQVGGGIPAIGAGLRFDAAGLNGYLFLGSPTATGIQIDLFKIVGGAATMLGGNVYYTPQTGNYVAGCTLKARVAIYGSTLLAKFWLASEAEPASWQATATDATFPSAGHLALYCSATNAGLSVGIDDIVMTDIVTGITPSLAVTTPANVIPLGTNQVSGTYTGYAPDGLLYAFDGATPATALTNVTASGGVWSGTFTGPVQGSHTVYARYTNATSVVSTGTTFLVAAALTTPTITVVTPQTSAVGSTLTISGTYTGADPAGLDYAIDGGSYTAVTSPTISSGTYSFQIAAPAAGAHTVAVQNTVFPTVIATSGAFITVATQTIAPNNAALVYSPYNWDVQSARALSINAGAYLRTFFSGNYIELDFDTSLLAAPYSEIEYRIDGYETQSPWRTVPVSAAIVPVMPSDTAALPFHLLEMRIKSTSETINRWNPAAAGTAVRLTGLKIAATGSVVSPGTAPINLLIYGDSITEGVRTVNETATNDTDRNDAAMGWAYDLGALLGAEVGIIGFGASGLTTGGSGGVPALTSSYNAIASGIARSFSPTPALIILNEGTNDRSASASSVTADLIAVVNGLLAACPNVPIAVLEPFGGYQAAALQAGVAGCGNPYLVTYVPTTGFLTTAYGIDSLGFHPSGPNNLAIIAPQVAAALRPLLMSTGAALWFRTMAA